MSLFSLFRKKHNCVAYFYQLPTSSKPITFSTIFLSSQQNVAALQNLYETPEDVDLVVAGSLERNVPGAQAGPTFLCILTEQFYRTRVGDRYFYENGADPDIAFTPSKLL